MVMCVQPQSFTPLQRQAPPLPWERTVRWGLYFEQGDRFGGEGWAPGTHLLNSFAFCLLPQKDVTVIHIEASPVE